MLRRVAGCQGSQRPFRDDRCARLTWQAQVHLAEPFRLMKGRLPELNQRQLTHRCMRAERLEPGTDEP